MKAPLSWLKEYVDINENIETLCKKMVSIGLEIEAVEYLGEKVKNIVVGQIKEIRQHPNADRLRCCTVDIGGESLLSIVTNAQNVNVNDKVPVALHNSFTANGMHITKGKMRGEVSDGMFCGLEELGITKDWYPVQDEEGVLVLKQDAIIGSDICDEVGLNDYVIDVAIPSNRQDCNSVYGLAREVAVALGTQLKPLIVDYVCSEENTEQYVNVEVQATDICPDYFMQGVNNVVIKRSPIWLTSRLAKIGLHGINTMVDITNYVLMEVGQPMHAFDYKDIEQCKIIIRRANEGEKIIALDNKEYTLNNQNLVIADGNKIVGLAGIMGGQNSGIKQDTTTVMFECARFAKDNIRHSSRQLGLRSDSSARFERGIDSYTTELGLKRALHLVCELNCGKVMSGTIAKSVATQQQTVVQFPTKRIKQLLGITIKDNVIIDILKSLDMPATIDNKILTVNVPPYREDIERDCDIIEELIRVYGYDNIKGTLMQNSHITKGGKTAFHTSQDKVRDIMCGLRYSQCIFYPFAGEALYNKLSLTEKYDTSSCIRLSNPLGEELSIMNISLVPNMLQCVALNHNRKNYNLRLYELGKVYLAEQLPLTKLPHEQNRLCMSASQDVTYDTFRQDVLQIVTYYNKAVKLVRSQQEYLHPNVSADILVNGEVVGCMGLVHPVIAKHFDLSKDTFVADIDFDKLYSLKESKFVFTPIAKFPAIERDFALVVDEKVLAQDLLDEIRNSCPLSVDAKLFDTYRSDKLGEGKKSLAISVMFRASDRTLSDNDIEKQVNRCLKVLEEKFGAVLRSE